MKARKEINRDGQDRQDKKRKKDKGKSAMLIPLPSISPFPLVCSFILTISVHPV
jgi:hypothetical protein